MAGTGHAAAPSLSRAVWAPLSTPDPRAPATWPRESPVQTRFLSRLPAPGHADTSQASPHTPSRHLTPAVPADHGGNVAGSFTAGARQGTQGLRETAARRPSLAPNPNLKAGRDVNRQDSAHSGPPRPQAGWLSRSVTKGPQAHREGVGGPAGYGACEHELPQVPCPLPGDRGLR